LYCVMDKLLDHVRFADSSWSEKNRRSPDAEIQCERFERREVHPLW